MARFPEPEWDARCLGLRNRESEELLVMDHTASVEHHENIL